MNFSHFPFLYLFRGQETPINSWWEGKVEVKVESVSRSQPGPSCLAQSSKTPSKVPGSVPGQQVEPCKGSGHPRSREFLEQTPRTRRGPGFQLWSQRPLETGLGAPLGHLLGPSHPGDLPLTQSPGPASGHFRGKSRQGCREPRRAMLSDETFTQPGATQSSKGSSRSAQLLPRAPRPGSGFPGRWS